MNKRIPARSIGKRLGLVLGLVLLISFIGSGIGLLALSEVAQETDAMFSQNLAAERAASDWYRNITNGVNRTSAIAFTTDVSLAEFFSAAAAESTKQASDFQKRLDGYMVSPEERKLFDRLTAARKEYLETRDAISAVKKAGEAERARSMFDQQFVPAAGRFQDAIQAIVKQKRERLDVAGVTLDRANQRARNALLGFSLIALALGSWFAYLLARSITRPLRGAAAVADAIARYDLSGSVPTGGSDETGMLLESLKDMQQQLLSLVGQVRGSAESIGTASSEIAVGNQDLSARTEQTASNLQEVAASMMQLTGTVHQTAEAAKTAKLLSGSAADSARNGSQVMQHVVATMGQISESSRRIAEIIGTIDGIAFQTNILALNAAVEAARAGDQGRGFAVVASEVRSLAQRSAAAAREIKALIGASVERVEAGSQLVGDAGVAMSGIVESVQRVAGIIGEISTSAREQSDGITQVNAAVGQLDQMTQQNAALVEQSAAAAESLRDQSIQLAGAISVFRLR